MKNIPNYLFNRLGALKGSCVLLGAIIGALSITIPSYAVSLTNITNGSLGDATEVMANDNALKGAIESFDGAQTQSGTIPGSAMRAGAQIPAEGIEGGTTNVTLQAFNSNYRQGCRIVYEAVGNVTVTAGQIMINGLLRSATSATDSAWTAASTTASGLDTGSEAASTYYNVFLCADDPNASTFTVVLSTAATVPVYTGATNYRKVGRIFNDSGSNIVAMINNGTDGLHMAEGKFLGDGSTMTITLGFQPIWVKVFASDATPASGDVVTIHEATGMMAIDGIDVKQDDATSKVAAFTTSFGPVTFTTTGFNFISTNTYIYYYIAHGY